MTTEILMYFRSLFLVLPLLCFAACATHTHDDEDHHAHEESVVVTRWTDSLEIFIEYPVPHGPGDIVFLTHLTRISDWSPISQGEVALLVTGPDGGTVETVVSRALRPGIYSIRHRFAREGAHTLQLVYRDAAFIDTCALPDVSIQKEHVHGDEENHQADAGATITFLKEQQWNDDFSTEVAAMQPVNPSVSVSGELFAPTGKMVDIAAPVNGILLVRPGSELPTHGTWVTKGRVLATLSPDPGNVSGLAQVRAEYLDAEADFERVQRLHADGAVSMKRLETARHRYDAARAGYDLLKKSASWEAGSADATLRITAPISGIVERINVRPGQHITAGQQLFVLADPSRLVLSARLPAAHASAAGNISDAWFEAEGFDTPYRVSALNGRLLSTGKVLDPATRTLYVAFEFDNPGKALSIGLYADTRIEFGSAQPVLAVPRSAIIDEGDGVHILYVQKEGEAFERRRVQPGRYGEVYVEVLDGLDAGERIVSRGAQLIRLASLSGSVPEHGHAH
jgi:membrane fusion protein, heavy metal efflux system